MPAKKEAKINLLPQNEFEASIMGRILRWLLSSFRIIVIVTEMLVMAAFLSRFWLDARNSDLNESIEEKVALISAVSDSEQEFRSAQKKIEVFSGLNQEPQQAERLHSLISFLPSEVTLTTVGVNENSIQVSGVSASEQGIAQYLTNLQSQEQFAKVELEQLGSSKENEAYLTFSLKIPWH
jgi:Tfp pilus assembly protein PilN